MSREGHQVIVQFRHGVTEQRGQELFLDIILPILHHWGICIIGMRFLRQKDYAQLPGTFHQTLNGQPWLPFLEERVFQAARWSLLVLRIGIFQMCRQQTRVVFLLFRVAIVLMMVVSTISIWMHFFGAQQSSIRMTHGTATWITMTMYLWTILISRLALLFVA